jgi:hypothetical protein
MLGNQNTPTTLITSTSLALVIEVVSHGIIWGVRDLAGPAPVRFIRCYLFFDVLLAQSKVSALLTFEA